MDKIRVAFPLIGGVHQVFHTAPVACALSIHAPHIETYIFASDERVLKLAERVAFTYPGSSVRFRLLRRFGPADLVGRIFGRAAWSKLPLLWNSREILNEFDAIVTPECTSIGLRSLGVTNPRFICIPHGAGDRAISFEPRFRMFDRVLVAGPKTASRMIQSGVQPNRVRIVGYPKTELIARLGKHAEPLFRNDRPIVLYNPHFRKELSSLDQAQAIVRSLVADGHFNVIVAPHIRSFENASRSAIDHWHGLAVPDRVLVDTGSERMVDMTFTAAADIYLGDVSSQVYEFLLTPRPCVFVDAHDTSWQGNPDYAFWRLGEVVSPANVVVAVSDAFENHGRYLPAQRAAIAATFGPKRDVCLTAASEILACIDEASSDQTSAAA